MQKAITNVSKLQVTLYIRSFDLYLLGLDCYGCIYSADSEHAVLRENYGCLIGRMNSTYLFPQDKWQSSRAGFVNAYGNAGKFHTR